MHATYMYVLRPAHSIIIIKEASIIIVSYKANKDVATYICTYVRTYVGYVTQAPWHHTNTNIKIWDGP